MTPKRMNNVLIVVEDLEAVKAFFIELGLTLAGETTAEGFRIHGAVQTNCSPAPDYRFTTIAGCP